MSAPEDRHDDLQDTIDDARRQAEESGSIPDPDPEPTFADPEGDGHADPPNNAPA